MLAKVKIAVLMFFLTTGALFPQKYNFVNFTVEDGLIQSQAMHIVQDKSKYLWVGTEGGLCKFDGKTFVKYSLQDGLVSNFINRLLCDANGNIWVATKKGISVFDGKKFTQALSDGKPIGNCSFLVQTKSLVYTVNNFRLGVIADYKFKKSFVTDTSEKVTAIYHTPKGDLLAYVYSKGIYCLKNDKWQLLHSSEGNLQDIVVRNIFITGTSDTLLTGSKGIFTVKKNKISYFKLNDGTPVDLNVFGIEELSSALWFGTDKGAYKIENGNLIHFNSRNGLTDNNVYSIFKDEENNLWFASDADGIFKFKENNFSFYDKSFGLVNPTIMGVAQTTDGNIYAADYSGNLYHIDAENKIVQVRLDGTDIQEGKINTIYADNENNLYIGSLGKRIYKYNPKINAKTPFVPVGDDVDYKLRGSNCFLKDKKGNLIVGNAVGLFVVNKENKVRKIEAPPATYNAIVQGDNGTVLIGSTNGLVMLDSNYKASFPKIKGIENNEILCLKYHNGIAWLGTTEHGMFRWDSRNNSSRQYNIAAKLPSNFIYSMIVRNNNDVWLGTGFGICNLVLDNNGDVVKVKNYSRAEGLIGMECNHTSELLAKDSTMWFGTTKGLAHFKPSGQRDENTKPYIILKSVKLFSADIKDSTLSSGFSPWYNIPENLVLKAKQNHLTFELTGIYLSNPEEILYKYKLEGIDKNYTISNNPVINYPALPPGKYTLVVYAITKSGVESSNSVNYSFEILKAFYQQAWFMLLAFFVITGSAGLIVMIYYRKKQNEKLMREKIREEEFTKLRQRTAEDFHDEMGNKLTRISVLTDILKSKVSASEKEALNIVNQIKENTTALYHGSRDIIWSLNSKNDNFYEITEHVKNLGQEIFSETQTNFHFDHNIKSSDNIKLKLDYSRNLIMIFKEVYNNILKHSQAHIVNARVELVDNKEAIIMISDNGRGFDSGIEHKGNGLKNMQNRIKRINGTFSINSSLNNGTEIMISLKDIFHI